MPILYIETIDAEEPDCIYVIKEDEQHAKHTKDANKVYGRCYIKFHDSILYDSGIYEKNHSGMSIKVRGNTSAYSDKKPYKIKLEKKADMLCRNKNEKYKDKNWILLKQSFIKNQIGFKTSELLNMPYTPKYRFVNLVINGDYKGLYMLTEAVSRNKCRVNIDKYNGYLLECDAYYWNETDTFRSSIYEYPYTIKYSYSKDDVEFIKKVIDNMEESIKKGNYQDFIDVESFVKWIYAHDIIGNTDCMGSNIYISYESGSKVSMASLWDFDGTLEHKYWWSEQHFYWYIPDLFDSQNKQFRDEYFDLHNKNHKYLRNELILYLLKYYLSSEGRAYRAAIDFDNKRWQANVSPRSELIDVIKFIYYRDEELSELIKVAYQ